MKQKDANKAAAELGRRGGLKGGKARAAALTPERRKEISTKALAKRYGKKLEPELQRGRPWTIPVQPGDTSITVTATWDPDLREVSLTATARPSGRAVFPVPSE